MTAQWTVDDEGGLECRDGDRLLSTWIDGDDENDTDAAFEALVADVRAARLAEPLAEALDIYASDTTPDREAIDDILIAAEAVVKALRHARRQGDR